MGNISKECYDFKLMIIWKKIFIDGKINWKIRNFMELWFFWLPTRQFILLVCNCIVDVEVYFVLKSNLEFGIVSWLCILIIALFTMLGFVKHSGMTIEKAIYILNRLN